MENKVKLCFISDIYCVIKMELVFIYNFIEIIEIEIIDSSSSGKLLVSSFFIVNIYIVVKIYFDGGWGWFVCVGVFFV